MKKSVSLRLCMVLVFAMLPVTVVFGATKHTEGIYTYTVENGKATIVKADDSYLEGNVVVPETLGGYPVVAIGDNAFFCCSFVIWFSFRLA